MLNVSITFVNCLPLVHWRDVAARFFVAAKTFQVFAGKVAITWSYTIHVRIVIFEAAHTISWRQVATEAVTLHLIVHIVHVAYRALTP